MSRNQTADKKALLEQLEKTPIVEVACKRVGLPRSTYYRWRKSDKEFAAKCDETIEMSAGRINDLAESQLINAIKEQNMTAIVFWLKHHHPKYESRLKINGRIKHEAEALSPEQEKVVAKALGMAGLLPGSAKPEKPKNNSNE